MTVGVSRVERRRASAGKPLSSAGVSGHGSIASGVGVEALSGTVDRLAWV